MRPRLILVTASVIVITLVMALCVNDFILNAAVGGIFAHHTHYVAIFKGVKKWPPGRISAETAEIRKAGGEGICTWGRTDIRFDIRPIFRGALGLNVSAHNISFDGERLFIFGALDKTLRIDDKNKIFFNTLTFDIIAGRDGIVLKNIDAQGDRYRMNGDIAYIPQKRKGEGYSIGSDMRVWINNEGLSALPGMGDKDGTGWTALALKAQGPSDNLKVTVSTGQLKLNAVLTY